LLAAEGCARSETDQQHARGHRPRRRRSSITSPSFPEKSPFPCSLAEQPVQLLIDLGGRNAEIAFFIHAHDGATRLIARFASIIALNSMSQTPFLSVRA